MFRDMRRKNQLLPPEEAESILRQGTSGVLSLLGDYLSYVSGVQNPALLWASLFTIVLSASAGLRTLFHTMDELYQVRRPRSAA